jgi:cyclophilin family peptidyl-prolyl cis-trans isomerase
VQTIHRNFDRYFALVLLAISFVYCGSSTFAQGVRFNPIERKLIEWTDARAHTDSIISYLRHSDEKIAWRAAIGLANIQDTLTRPAIIKALREEKREAIQDALSFALGCLGPNESSASAINFAAHENLSVTKLESLGRTVTNEQLPKTLRYLITEVTSRSAIDGLMQIALRNMPVSTALKEAALESKFEDLMLALSESNNNETRWKTAYFYSRLNDSALNLEHLEIIQTLLNDQGEPLARMFAATALARIHNLQAQNILVRALRSEREWRVRVNVLNALSRAAEVDSLLLVSIWNTILSAETDNDGSIHAAEAAWTTMEDLVWKGKVRSSDTSELVSFLHSLTPSRELYPGLPVQIRSRALPVLAYFGHSERLHDFVLEMNGVRDRFVREQTLRAIGKYEDTLGFVSLLQNLAVVQPQDQLPYIAAIGELWQKAKKTPWFMAHIEERRYAHAFRRMLIRMPSITDDPAIVSTVLELLKDSTVLYNQEFRDDAKQHLGRYLVRYRAPEYEDQLNSVISVIKWIGERDDSLMLGIAAVAKMANTNAMYALQDSAVSAIKVVGGAELEFKTKAPRKPIDWAMLENSSDTVLISTDKGLMYLRLFKYEAPLTSLNFLQLSKISYFANNVFHRVVPNFVIQAGDRTRTGYGGPGYSIRREVAPIGYTKAGIMGMASSGKDTEGSQWFITHLPTPHLDTRYTVFGEIVAGTEVIDRIHIYDEISNIFQEVK